MSDHAAAVTPRVLILMPAGTQEEGAFITSADTLLFYQTSHSLAQAIYLSGLVQPPVLCSGLALCGRCRLQIISSPLPLPAAADVMFFTPDELATGFRLGCRHVPLPGMRVVLPSGALSPHQALEDAFNTTERHFLSPVPFGINSEHSNNESPRDHGSWATAVMAVDLGTTSVAWQLLGLSPEEDSAEPSILWEGSLVNPQMGAGSDIISRIAVASSADGLRTLHELTRSLLQELIRQASERIRNHGGFDGVHSLCVAGNTAQTAILLGRDCRGLRMVPYTIPYAGGQWEDLPGLPPAWLPPQVSAFAGGDISAGYAALTLDPRRKPPSFPFLLADMGTNGEFVLALSETEAMVASVALGPALEGSGLRHGTEARASAVNEFRFTPNGLEMVQLPNDAASDIPVGITGTGYLSLLHILAHIGVLDRDGHFIQPYTGLLKRCFMVERGDNRSGSQEQWLPLPGDLRLYASDVEEILKVKAAFSLGLQRLLANAALTFSDLTQCFVAGALGRHLAVDIMENLGFVPPGGGTKLCAVGNTSLIGAGVLLRHPRARDALVDWARGVSALDLATDPAFTQDYPLHMRFEWRKEE